ncbi:helix-turn-helix domain-containing protein [Peribacillus tepidiphilus]|jgi:HTH-type transcriptional regulator / antitoxin PezA|uniref:helix-turn-helix domain-containing protein n=1 Tax=Peribacillus tepidiphilus TaxID=2652445 RepID=UPI0012911376|nr:helix-turn-helix transcriptional regulator [Peribacillus tepidiphilus]
MNQLVIGRLIKELRREKGITMIDFAKKINISQPSLSRIESGNQEVSLALLSKICEEFGISLSEFFLRAEGNSEFQKMQLELTNEDEDDIVDELDRKLNRMLSALTVEQKKGLYVLLLPYIKE